MKKYVTWLPAWTPLLTYKEYPGITDLKVKQRLNRSNIGAIEGFHKDIKSEIRKCTFIGDTSRVRIDDYITHIHNHLVNTIIYKVKLKIPNTRNTKGKKAH